MGSIDLNAWLSTWLSNPDTLRLFFVGGIAIAAFLLVLLLSNLKQRLSNPVRDRIASLQDRKNLTAKRHQRLIERVGREIVPKDPKKRGKTEQRLIYAGYRTSSAVAILYALKLLCIALLTPIIALGLWWVLKMSVAQALQYGLWFGLIGFILPDYLVVQKMKRRQIRIRRGLPDALDMLVVTGEAGLGLNAAIDRVASEIDTQHPELASELALVTAEMRAGLDSTTAMRGLYDRNGIDEIKSLVATMLQAMRFGTSIADTLRIYAEEMRDKRLQAVEEQAAKLEIKMLFPITLFILPAFMLVAIGPSLIALTKTFEQLSG